MHDYVNDIFGELEQKPSKPSEDNREHYSAKYPKLRTFGDAYILQAEKILADTFSGECHRASDTQDREHATDALLLTGNTVKSVAIRIRSTHYRARFGNEITMRSRLTTTNGTEQKTEYEKIIYDKRGDYLFYGFGDAGKLQTYKIIDLAKVREQIADINIKHLVCDTPNGDGSYFRAYDLAWFENCVIKQGCFSLFFVRNEKGRLK